MISLVLASQNTHKLKEFQFFLNSFSQDLHFLSLRDFPHHPPLLENCDTFLENARSKAEIMAEHSGQLTLADDSGIEVEALNWAPGVYSARYASTDGTCDDAANNQKLLEELIGVPSEKRKARYRCVLMLIDPKKKKSWQFEGICEGVILFESQGHGGFGYDPLFYMPDVQCTMAQLAFEKKNQISHRARAFQKLVQYLPQILEEKKCASS
jgi:XTP/dITP diphosphohydrolase